MFFLSSHETRSFHGCLVPACCNDITNQFSMQIFITSVLIRNLGKQSKGCPREIIARALATPNGNVDDAHVSLPLDILLIQTRGSS
ncbi:unnamed protein product [Chondrus crispus]|uniref:Uncharacterized protein n=1 Tax=Chondrus crispus TaxID=2769 RepID=R7QNC8_CHOCR|nr:unnamed protein product [Chondrus crispus]CDF39987.1 unnamed protein product [Chondrus crispus]|eukprot:XP_005710281.1 unnamed protein product [Chondrus crispus]